MDVSETGANETDARSKILERADEEEWLSLATEALSQHWEDKNARKAKKQNGHARPVKK